jgi:hypothetical protein
MSAHLPERPWDKGAMDIDIWPFAALRITTPRLEPRYPDDDLADSHSSAPKGIHDGVSMPCSEAWTRRQDRSGTGKVYGCGRRRIRGGGACS